MDTYIQYKFKINHMNLTELTIDQLKVIAFDQIKLLEQSKNNLSLIYAELSKRNESQIKDEVANDK